MWQKLKKKKDFLITKNLTSDLDLSIIEVKCCFIDFFFSILSQSKRSRFLSYLTSRPDFFNFFNFFLMLFLEPLTVLVPEVALMRVLLVGGVGGADFSPLFIKQLICINREQLTQRLYFFSGSF